MSKHLSQIIIEKLLPGSQKVSDLVLTISLSLNVSLQAVYKALRVLNKQEVVTIHNKVVSLSIIWITKEKEKFLFAEYAYKINKDIITRLLKEKSKVVFTFKTIAEQDLFWTHVYTLLAEKTISTRPRYLITPHDFFLYARKETDTFWIEKNIKKDVATRLVITHTTKADVLVTKERKKTLSKSAHFLLHENPLEQKSDTYYNILGDYIFKAVFDRKVNNLLEKIIHNINRLPITKVEQSEISNIIHTKGNFVFSIEKNKTKADAMEKKLKKYFE